MKSKLVFSPVMALLNLSSLADQKRSDARRLKS
jgi:hypothetical protein